MPLEYAATEIGLTKATRHLLANRPKDFVYPPRDKETGVRKLKVAPHGKR